MSNGPATVLLSLVWTDGRLNWNFMNINDSPICAEAYLHRCLLHIFSASLLVPIKIDRCLFFCDWTGNIVAGLVIFVAGSLNLDKSIYFCRKLLRHSTLLPLCTRLWRYHISSMIQTDARFPLRQLCCYWDAQFPLRQLCCYWFTALVSEKQSRF